MKESRKLLDAWLPPPGCGSPVSVLATSFTFDADFFEDECLARFLSLQGKAGEGDRQTDLHFVIDREERLGDVRVAALVDRSSFDGSRTLRCDLLPVSPPGGLLHAKVSLLVWEKLVRVLIGSANLTPAGYRRQLETSVCFDAAAGSEVPRSVFDSTFAALEQILALAPGDPRESGPKERALAALAAAKKRVEEIDLPNRLGDGAVVGVWLTRPGDPHITSLKSLWRGGPPRRALVVSPFFDTDEGANLPARALVESLAQRGEREISFLVPVDESAGKTVLHAPRSLHTEIPANMDLSFHPIVTPEEEESQRLHAKLIRLESESWTAVAIGSSNFTTAGLGLHGTRGHLEVNVGFGTSAGSKIDRELRRLFERHQGPAVSVDNAAWEPIGDEDTPTRPVLPLGFEQCLLKPGAPDEILLWLRAELLPDVWEILLPNREPLLTSAEWRHLGSPARVERPVAGVERFFVLDVHWRAADGLWHASWPLNVTDPSQLPLASELRNLSVRDLLEALASTRPLPAELARLLVRREGQKGSADSDQLDPLKRYSSTGQLMARTRRFSLALDGLRRRLERPTSSVEALRWRLAGPFGPLAIGRGLAAESNAGRTLAGEVDFQLAELARMVAAIHWKSVAVAVKRDLVRATIQETLAELAALRPRDSDDPLLARYVDQVFDEVVP